MPTEFCPDCKVPIRIRSRPRTGQRLNCPHCTARLEVAEFSPLEFYWAEDEQPFVLTGAKIGAGARAGSADAR
jgi:hypothetical protein